MESVFLAKQIKVRVRSSNGVTQNYGNYRYGNYVSNAPRQ